MVTEKIWTTLYTILYVQTLFIRFLFNQDVKHQWVWFTTLGSVQELVLHVLNSCSKAIESGKVDRSCLYGFPFFSFSFFHRFIIRWNSTLLFQVFTSLNLIPHLIGYFHYPIPLVPYFNLQIGRLLSIFLRRVIWKFRFGIFAQFHICRKMIKKVRFKWKFNIMRGALWIWIFINCTHFHIYGENLFSTLNLIICFKLINIGKVSSNANNYQFVTEFPI